MPRVFLNLTALLRTWLKNNKGYYVDESADDIGAQFYATKLGVYDENNRWGQNGMALT
jgi:hypothetical protein